MGDRIIKYLIMAVFAAPAAYWLYKQIDPTPSAQAQRNAGMKATREERRRQRARQWARPGRGSQISAVETIREIRIPDEELAEVEALDRICLLYTHQGWQIATLTCPPTLIDVGPSP